MRNSTACYLQIRLMFAHRSDICSLIFEPASVSPDSIWGTAPFDICIFADKSDICTSILFARFNMRNNNNIDSILLNLDSGSGAMNLAVMTIWWIDFNRVTLILSPWKLDDSTDVLYKLDIPIWYSTHKCQMKRNKKINFVNWCNFYF